MIERIALANRVTGCLHRGENVVSNAIRADVAKCARDPSGTTANTTAIAGLDVRTTADTATIAVETAARIQAVTNGANARIAEDKRLGGLIDAEASARAAEDKRLDGLIGAETRARLAANNEIKDRIASSTATAIALGGTTILPDMNFTLSGNVGFYEGAQALALNAAAKIGPNAYITAAAGGGTNKKGNIGGRVGFVIGF